MDEPPDAKISYDDVHIIMNSSGTKGAPKGVVNIHYFCANYCINFASA